MRRQLRPDFKPSGFFVLRTPLLPYEDFEAWSADLGAPVALDDSERLADAIDEDRARLRLRLRQLLQRPEIREALFVGSPSLSIGIEAWLRDPDSKRGRRAEETLVRYFLRMVTRCTPFGLFAGCSLGSFGSKNALELAERSSWRRHTRLDMGYLSALTEELNSWPQLRRELHYKPNPGLYLAAGHLHYAEVRQEDGRCRLAVVESSDRLHEALGNAAGGSTLEILAIDLVEEEPGLTLAEAEAFLDELVDRQLLVSELAVNVTGEEPIARLIELLARHDATTAISDELAQAHGDLAELDRQGLGNDPASYRTVARRLEKKLPAKVELPRLFQVDLFKPVVDAELDQAVVDEILRGLTVLQKMAGPFQERDALQRFSRRFVERYGYDNTVPLIEALDEEIGIGFDGSAGFDPPAFLDDLELPGPAGEESVPWGDNQGLLLRKLEKALREGASHVDFTDQDFAGSTAEPSPLPDALQVAVTIAASSREALAAGDFKIWLRHASGPSGARFLGRFCHADEELKRRVEEHLRAEEQLEPDAMFAEIVHLPSGRLGNVLFRPRLRRYEIPYVGVSGAPEKCQLPIWDLHVSVSGRGIALFSERNFQRVLPRLSSGHDYWSSGLAVYRFLGALQSQGTREGLWWTWGVFNQLPYLPRAQSGRLVLARARWLVRREELADKIRLPPVELYRAVQIWRRDRGLPRRVLLVEGDNELLIDFDNILSLESFVAIVKRSPQVVLVESFPSGEELCVEGSEGRYLQELLVPLVKERELRPEPDAPWIPDPPPIGFAPGTEWLYVKLYAGPMTSDRNLRELVGPLQRRALEEGWADRGFFVRYSDPEWHLRWRLHGDPQALRGPFRALLEEALEPFLRDRRVWRVQYDTYERELERYGGPYGVELAERLFHVDSEAVIEMLHALEDGEAARWQMALYGSDRLLADFGFDDPTELDVLHQLQKAYARELRAGSTFKKQLAAKLRKAWPTLEALLQEEEGSEETWGRLFEICRRRSERLVPIITELRGYDEEGHVVVPLTEIASSCIHMFNNRLLRSHAMAHEMVLYDFLYRLRRSRAVREESS